MEKRIHVKDLAPYASIEDLSDERESPLEEEKQKSKLPNIEEEMKALTNTNLNVTNTTPRIDISRASSSSHQEDSSPEREFILGRSKDSKLEVVFGEEMTSDLHSSTEELSFHDTEGVDKLRKKKSSQTLSDVQVEIMRKDSGCSNDFALLSISGRTSRVSSVGSVASAGSGQSNVSAVSRCSASSHLSAASNISRGSSPHRMSLETSFCGPKPMHNNSIEVDSSVKSIILGKFPKKTGTVYDHDIINDKTSNKQNSHREYSKNVSNTDNNKIKTSYKDNPKYKRKKPKIENPKTQKFVSLHSDEEEESIATRCAVVKPNNIPVLDNNKQIFIPLHDENKDKDDNPSSKCEPNPSSPKRLKPFTNTTLVNFISKYDVDGNIRRNKPNTDKNAGLKAGHEEIYIPKEDINEEFQKFICLKDDDDLEEIQSRKRFITHDNKQTSITINQLKEKLDESFNRITVPIQVHQENNHYLSDNIEKLKCGSTSYVSTTSNNCQYVPLHGSDSILQTRNNYDLNNEDNENNLLSVKKFEQISRSDEYSFSYLSSKEDYNNDERSSTELLTYRERPSRSTRSMTQLINTGIENYSRTPSPNASVTNNNYPFRRCSESAKEIRNIDQSKSRSGSIKSIFSSFFKRSGSAKNKGNNKTGTRGDTAVIFKIEPTMERVQNEQVDSIIIPLHSPNENLTYLDRTYMVDIVQKIGSEDLSLDKRKIIDKINKKIIPSPCSLKTESSKTDIIKHQLSIVQDLQEHNNFKTKEFSESSIKSAQNEKPTNLNENFIQSHNDRNYTTSFEDYQSPKQKTNENKVERIADNKVKKQKLKEETLNCDPLLDVKNTFNDANDDTDISTDSEKVKLVILESDDESKKLMNQEESFEELPYIPTTLPSERSVAVPIIPIKDRCNNIQTKAVDRPRSNTLLNTSFDPYVITKPSKLLNAKENTVTEKLYITLPRTGSTIKNIRIRNFVTTKTLQPNSVKNNLLKSENLSFSCFVEDNFQMSSLPLPNRKSPSWISFEDKSEKVNRQSPRRITTLPSSFGIGDYNFNYEKIKINQSIILVNPNECSCECHELQHIPIKNTYFANNK